MKVGVDVFVGICATAYDCVDFPASQKLALDNRIAVEVRKRNAICEGGANVPGCVCPLEECQEAVEVGEWFYLQREQVHRQVGVSKQG